MNSSFVLKSIIPKQYKRTLKRLYCNFIHLIKYNTIKKNINFNNFNFIVFVCKGNICRSAFAEYYIRSRLTDNSIIIESCGIEVNQGIYSPREAIFLGKEFGIELSNHVSKGLDAVRLDDADIVIPMEFSQYIELAEKYPEHLHKLKLLQDFAPWPGNLFCNIYDPYGLGEAEFRYCFKKMKKALDPLVKLLDSSTSIQSTK
jgi:protein-tyrosine phosphatase